MWFTILTVFITIIAIVVSLVVMRKRFIKFDYKDPDIRRFSVPVQWDPYPMEIDIENKYDCNADSLRKCDIDDPTTLVGCKEMAVRCHHFDHDQSYYANGHTTIIPKNSSPTEGYALAITSLADACNPYHGDLVLVGKNAESTEYMMICNCKNPGYIGNEDILGACEDVFICDGKIDDLNRPLDEINCVCNETEVSLRYEDGLPVCKELLVHEANKRYTTWTHLVPWQHDRLIETSAFNPTVRDNVSTRFLVDPCRTAIDTGDAIENGHYDSHLKSCTFRDYGLPVRLNLLDRLKEPPDKRVPYETVDSALATKRHESVRFTDNVAGKRMLINVKTRLVSHDNANTDVYANLPERVGMSDNGQFVITARKQLVACRCTGDWPRYYCDIKEYYQGSAHGVPYPGYREAPGSFLWGTEDWEAAERAVSSGIRTYETGTVSDNTKLMAKDSWHAFGIRYCSDSTRHATCVAGLLSFRDLNDYKRHKSVIT